MDRGIISAYDADECVKVRMRFGAEGYLAYMAIQELLCRNSEHVLSRDYDELSSSICVDANVVKGVVESLGLFVVNDDTFESASINQYYESRKKLSESKAKGGRARWAKNKVANAVDEQANATDERANAKSNDANAVEIDANAPDVGANALFDTANAKNDKKEIFPPITPYKEKNALTGGSDIIPIGINLFSPACACEEKPKEPKTRKRKAKDPEMVRLNSGARKTFEEVYRQYFGEPYYWQGDDAGQMTKLLNKIRFSRTDRQQPLDVDTDSMLGALRQFLLAINKEWIIKNFSVKMIASNYNEIISEIKNRNSNGTIRFDARSYAAAPKRNPSDFDEEDD